jgi:hypothetical protein
LLFGPLPALTSSPLWQQRIANQTWFFVYDGQTISSDARSKYEDCMKLKLAIKNRISTQKHYCSIDFRLTQFMSAIMPRDHRHDILALKVGPECFRLSCRANRVTPACSNQHALSRHDQLRAGSSDKPLRYGQIYQPPCSHQ